MLFTLFFGIYVRFEDTSAWQEKSTLFFHNGEPIYSEFDSFYFAKLSLDIKEGEFKSGYVDKFRFFPDNITDNQNPQENFAVKYSIPGNFISFIFYSLSQLLGISIPWLSYYLIPIITSTVAIPLFFYFKRIDLPLAGIFGGFIVLTSHYYFSRTMLMKLDHDMLNLTFPFLIAYLYLRFFQSNNLKEKYFFISLSSVVSIFYYLWYGHSNLNFVLVLTFFIAYLYEPLKNFIIKKSLKFKISKHDIIFFIILIGPQIWYLIDGPAQLLSQVSTYIFKIKSPSINDQIFKDFPYVFIFISELKKESFNVIVSNIVYSKFIFIIGLIGSILLFIFNLRNAIFIFPLFLVGLLVFHSGVRFGMYLAPFIGIGLGYVVHFLFKKILSNFLKIKEKWNQKLTTSVLGLVIFVILIVIQKDILERKSEPVITSVGAKEIEAIKDITPPDAVIWSWWDNGYPFQYYSRRAVFHDGGSQNTPKTYLIARSFVVDDPKEAWLITSYISNYGLSGMVKTLKQGTKPQELLQKIRRGDFIKPIDKPVYWVLTGDMMYKFGNIHYIGTYDFNKHLGTYGKINPIECTFKDKKSLDIIVCPQFKNAVFNLRSGIINFTNSSTAIKTLYLRMKNNSSIINFNERGLNFAIITTAFNQIGFVVAETPSENTLFFKMFILREYDPKYFELVYDRFPVLVVYKVKDKLE